MATIKQQAATSNWQENNQLKSGIVKKTNN
jgi:hypothetical protein